MAKPTEEQIQELKKLLEDLESARVEAENLANSTKETLEAATGNLGQQYTDLVDEIKGALKKQYEFLSSQELSVEIQLKLIQKQKEERAKLIQLQQRQLGILENLSDAQRDVDTTAAQLVANEAKRLQLAQELSIEENKQAKDTTKIAKLNQEIAKSGKEQQSIINRQSTAQARVTSLTEKAVRSGIEENEIKDKTVQELENLIGAQEAAIENQRDLTKESQKTSDTVQETQSRIRNNNSIIDNTISKMTGLSVRTGGFAELLAEAGDDQDRLNELSTQFAQRLKLATSPVNILLNIFSKISSVVSEITTKVNGMAIGVQSLATDIIETPITFRRDTGLTRAVGAQLADLKKASAAAGFSVNETDLAFRGLATSMVSFTRMDLPTRKFLTEQARLFQRAGLNSDTFGKSIEGLTKTMGMDKTVANALTDEIMAFGGVVGIDVNKAVQDFTANLDLLATFGRERGVTIFKNLAAAANEAGVEIQTLKQIGDKFETFDSAMRSAGKLNFILRGPFLNSMELLKATPDETLEILRKGFDKAGKSFDSFGRRGREAIARTLGVSVDVAKRLFDDRSLKSAKDLENSLMDRARAAKSVNDISLKELTLQQKQELMYEKTLAALMPLAEMVNKLFNAFYDFMNTGAGTAIMTFFTGLGNVMAYVVPFFITFAGPAIMGKLATSFQSLIGKGTAAVGVFQKMATGLGAIAGGIMSIYAARLQLADLDKRYAAGELSKEEYEKQKSSTKTGAGIGTGASTAILGVQAGLAAGGIPGAIVGGVLGFGAGYFGAGAFLNEGVDNFRPGRQASPIRTGGQDVGLAFLGDGPGGVMTPYTEAAILPGGTAVLNSGDVNTLSESVKSMPGMLEMMTSAIADSVNVAINAVDAKNKDREENMQMNLVIKMEDEPVAKIARRTSMEVLRRGFEIG